MGYSDKLLRAILEFKEKRGREPSRIICTQAFVCGFAVGMLSQEDVQECLDKMKNGQRQRILMFGIPVEINDKLVGTEFCLVED